jgi:hypothetical protein
MNMMISESGFQKSEKVLEFGKELAAVMIPSAQYRPENLILPLNVYV